MAGTLDLLRRVPTFEGLPDDQITWFLSQSEEVHLKPGEGDFDFPALFRRLDELGFAGHYMNVFGTLDDMVEGREILAKLDPQDAAGKRKAS